MFYKIKGSFLAQQKKNYQAIEAYSTAFNILKKHPNETDFTKDNQFITGGNITSVHRDLIKLLSENNTESNLRKQVEQSLTEHLYAQLIYFLNAKNWADADRQTFRLMLNISKAEKQGYLYEENINRFSCPDLQKIDKLWISNSDKRFGFSVQKEIWIKTHNRLGIKVTQWNDNDGKNYLQFARAVGWYDDKVRENETGDHWLTYNELIESIKVNPSWVTLPLYPYAWGGYGYGYGYGVRAAFRGGMAGVGSFLALRLVNCNR
ncbi:MAG: GUN4 domain-containing protein [Rhizonema sp. NSF051]|nr:GUN4 domain-containing protein [Rhizonema sp. NSF051]